MRTIGIGKIARQREHFVRGRGTALRGALAAALSCAIDGDIIRVIPNCTSRTNDFSSDGHKSGWSSVAVDGELSSSNELQSQCQQDLVVRRRVHIARAYTDELGNICEGRAELSFGLVLLSPARVTGLTIDLRQVDVDAWQTANGREGEPREPACVRIGGSVAEGSPGGGSE